MNLTHAATIAAIATPPGRGGIGVIRVSGTRTAEIARAVLGKAPAPRQATYSAFRDSDTQPIDDGIALFFPAPHSLTGEDVLELQGHGGPVIMDMLLKRVLTLGARPAGPGEFSERAFLNGKLDLAQAEAIADLIDSHTEQAARSALRSLHGAFSSKIHRLVEALIELRSYVEAALDFPDEEIDFLAEESVNQRLQTLKQQLAGTFDQARQGSILREGMTLVIAGRPNAGKSSLLNRLATSDVAIVTEVPGTTRDALRQDIQIDGMPLQIIDTAGLRESTDPLEREGIRRAWAEIEAADLILLVVDQTFGMGNEERTILKQLPKHRPVLTIWNKIDLGDKPAGKRKNIVYVSALTGAGFDALRDALKDQIGYHAAPEGIYLARRRHLVALHRASEALESADGHLRTCQAGELLAEDLRAAQDALSEITGTFTSEDLLGRIFSSFCVGK
ncbi:MAG TPA: tRNA uridine-5-carboxymethylaminomethyl(34) synthesis GTPase MnmE [Gammaproteobacteria bacterium]|nr:tRNA uridine-5-carboxymethylaminomethyl(34) synthesis GTPase MnmE [Gammaproteobacteria bacterium]